MSGELYQLIFANGKSYIGISVNARQRFKDHANAAKGKCCFPVYYAWRKYGEPVLIVLATVEDRELLYLAEIEAIDKFKTLVPNGYNVALGGQISPSLSPGVAEKISASRKGIVYSEETKIKMSLAKIGTKRPPFSDSHRAKLSAAAKLRKQAPHSAESRRKRREKMTGKIMSEEAKMKIRLAHLGKIIPEETRIKMSISKKAYYERKRKEQSCAS